MGTIESQIASLAIVYSIVYSSADQRKHQSSVSLAFVWGIHWGPVNSPHKWPVTRKMIPFDDVMMNQGNYHKYIKFLINLVTGSGDGLVLIRAIIKISIDVLLQISCVLWPKICH